MKFSAWITDARDGLSRLFQRLKRLKSPLPPYLLPAVVSSIVLGGIGLVLRRVGAGNENGLVYGLGLAMMIVGWLIAAGLLLVFRLRSGSEKPWISQALAWYVWTGFVLTALPFHRSLLGTGVVLLGGAAILFSVIYLKVVGPWEKRLLLYAPAVFITCLALWIFVPTAAKDNLWNWSTEAWQVVSVSAKKNLEMAKAGIEALQKQWSPETAPALKTDTPVYEPSPEQLAALTRSKKSRHPLFNSKGEKEATSSENPDDLETILRRNEEEFPELRQ